MKSFAIAALLGLTSAAPTALTKRWPSEPAIITPTYISHYNLGTGGLVYNPATGAAHFDALSTISAFSVPAGIEGKKCSLHFYLDPTDSTAAVSGSGGVQVFSTHQVPPAYDVESWGPPGNQRNQHYGNFKVHTGYANVDDWPRLLEDFKCPAEGEYGFEVVAKWATGIEWDAGLSGLYMKYE
ncbi:hypothetical protein BU26DRAFT_555647 [Trematosphaeria pertusa]|uniref:Ubiquitin 3 binding protein But2 C-terminal domain-containing protein n=1 Tax=Trematosphaeria pertusa TaxID=390896 RepID=A0A6A6HYL8_9PLEO|nr:uncharacterized protein BU26DRAFT_555647 [Trematosphaeria pertusa]KAF2242450.1 hypothetical protein BU26DRAFT_555647 [Trematosphaeria pertusa]